MSVFVAGLALAAPVRASTPVRVAIIVGPVGEELTPVYISLAEASATAAETRGATVARAYSPDASAENVLAAVEGANIVIYLGHGVGSPNPYSADPNAATTNGWGLNGPGAVGTHADSWQDGSLAYYGESWIAEHAKPAPGWVMIYSNACYAPGASEGFDTPADEAVAATRVSAYSRAPLAELGASAYFATDFYEGAAHLVATMLDRPDLPFGEVFASEPRYLAEGLTRLPHGLVEGAETWLQRSPYFDGKLDYWYAFAGNPAASLGLGAGRAWQPGSGFPSAGVASVLAIPYAETPGHEGQPSVVLAAELSALLPAGTREVEVCAERCASLPVLADLPLRQDAEAGASDQPALGISQHAWALLTDRPIDGSRLAVRLRLHPAPPPPPASALPPPPSAVLVPPALPSAPALPPSLPSAPPSSPSPTPSPAAPTPSPPPAVMPSPTPQPSPTPTAPPLPSAVVGSSTVPSPSGSPSSSPSPSPSPLPGATP